MQLLKRSLFLLILLCSWTSAFADSLASKFKTNSTKLADDHEWSIETGTGFYISDVRTDLNGYTFVPATLTASTVVDEISLDNFAYGTCRGYTEFMFRGFGLAVVHGIESRFIGISLGPRYNFCQPNWKWVPFVEGNVGFAFNDSRGLTLGAKQMGQGQDFSFQFGMCAGVRYDITNDWFLRLTATYTHFSNAGLSEPVRKNRAIDAVGPEISVGYNF
jgi:hypothetical protein